MNLRPVRAEITDPRHQKMFMFLVAFAPFIGTIDSTIVNIALPTISREFAVSLGTVSWVIIGYMLVMSSFILIFGKMGDMWGFKRFFILGFIVFVAGSFLCGIAWSFETLILFRMLQGIGAGMFSAIAPGMIPVFLPPGLRGMTYGLQTTAAGLGLSLGPVLGGFLTQYLGWSWIFFVNVPVAFVGIALAMRYLPGDHVSVVRGTFDLSGAVLSFIGLATIIFALTEGYLYGWTSPVILSCFAVAAVSAPLFFWHERHCLEPIIRFSLFHVRNFSLGNLGIFMAMVLQSGALFLLPFYFEQAKGMNTALSGIFLMLPAVMIFFIGPISGRMSDTIGSRLPCMIAGSIGLIACLILSGFSETTALYVIVIALLLFGVNVGMSSPPFSRSVMNSVPKQDAGMGGSTMMMIRKLGQTTGVVIFSFVYYSVTAVVNPAGDGAFSLAAMVQGFDVAFLVGAGTCVMLIVAGYLLRDDTGKTPGRG